MPIPPNAQRQALPGSRQASRDSRADAAARRMANPLAGGLRALVQPARELMEREAAALPAWRGADEPVSAETPQDHSIRASLLSA
jgi:hypothetical protein